MPTRRLILIVVVIILVAVLTPLVIDRYYLTPSSIQRAIESAPTQRAAR